LHIQTKAKFKVNTFSNGLHKKYSTMADLSFMDTYHAVWIFPASALNSCGSTHYLLSLILTSSSSSMFGFLMHMVANTMRDFCPSDSCLMRLVCILPLMPKRPRKARHWSTSLTKPLAASLG